MYQFIKLLMFVLVCSIPYKALAQENNLILFEKNSVVWAEFSLQGEYEAIIRFYQNEREVKNLTVKIVKGEEITRIWVEPSHRNGGICKNPSSICLHLDYTREGNVVRVPIKRSPQEIAGTTAKLFVVRTIINEMGKKEHLTISEGTSIDVADALISSTPRTQFIDFMETHRVAIQREANKEVPSVSEACAEDYADRLTKPYECMRSLIPGVQQLHNVLTYLRSNAPWVPATATTSPYVRIIDEFSEGATHGEYVSLAFESVSANKRNACERYNEQVNGIFYCYSKSPAVEQVNLSRGGLDFEPRGSIIVAVSREQFLSEQIRAGVGTGNTPYNANPTLDNLAPPVLGPLQSGLGDVMDTGYLTLVGGWDSRFMLDLLLSPDYATRIHLTGITEEQIINLSSNLFFGSRSCEKEGGVPATKKWCVLFPHYFFYFEEGVRREERGTSGAVALYNGVFDLLRTIYHPIMTASETDALIRSCAIDTNPDGFEEVLDDFPEYENLFTEEEYGLTLPFYGESGVDSMTGFGKGDLSCLFEEDGSLVANPKSLIKSSLL